VRIVLHLGLLLLLFLHLLLFLLLAQQLDSNLAFRNQRFLET